MQAMYAPPGSERSGSLHRAGRRILELARRSLMWLELGIGGVAATTGSAAVVLGIVRGNRDPHHGGMMVIFGGLFITLIGALFLCGGLCLRSRRPVAWLGQLLPMSFGAWALWDALSH